jgi:CubicO group peptidase (beta-lactamase class C family)
MIIMKKTILLFAIIHLACSIRAQEITKKIEILINSYSEIYRFNGVVLVSKKGKVLFEKGFGYRDIEHKLPNTPHTIYQIGSMTKQFTAVVILKLEEQKKLTLQDKLNKYFPDYPRGNEITIEHLLTHTSGIYEYFRSPQYNNRDPKKLLSKEERMSLFKDKPLDFSPGTKFSYCNSGYELLGLIIEQLTHKPYELVVREYLLNPLKMSHTGFDFRGLNNYNKAKPYSLYSKKETSEAEPWDSTATFSAGGLYSTMQDLYLWHRGLLNNQIVATSSLEKAYTPFLNGYGYGFWIDSLYNKRVISHGGNVQGFTTQMIRIPEDDVCIILINNTYNHEIETIGNSIVAILYDKPYKNLKEISLSNEVLEKYVGEYEISNDYVVNVTKDDLHLYVQIKSEPRIEIFAEKENYFFIKDEDLRIRFKPDDKGKIIQISIFRGLSTKRGDKKV